MAAQLLMCKNDRCTNIVPESKNSGVKKLFCTTRCARRYHSRVAYEREAGGVGDGMLIVDQNAMAQVSRKMPPNKKVAEARFKSHNRDCALSPIGRDRQCPAFFDAYDRKKLCLIHAVLNDDWWQLDAAEDGRPYERKTTTQDGHWISDMMRLGIPAPGEIPLPKGTPSTAEQVAAFVAAGGGVPPKTEVEPW